MTNERRLYGRNGDEYLFWDMDDVVEAYRIDGDGDQIAIEEWTTHDTRYHLPSAARLGEFICEWAADHGEITEDMGDQVAGACEDSQDAIRALLDLIADKITYVMADTHVATFLVTVDRKGNITDTEQVWSLYQ